MTVWSVVYGGVTLTAPSPIAPGYDIRANTKVLLTGKQKVFATAYYGTTYRFVCFPSSYAQISALLAMIGTGTTLTVNGDSLSGDWYIRYLKPQEVTPNQWQYEIELVNSTE